jgi:hypothetical protein
VREYQGVKMSRAELDRIVSEEIVRDDDLLAKLCGLGVDEPYDRVPCQRTG